MSERVDYPAQVFWSDEDSAYLALAPDLPGASAVGCTRLEALAELDQAIEVWLEASSGAGNALPEPSTPAAARSHNGKIALRLPSELHSAAARQADHEGTSLNQWLSAAIAIRLGRLQGRDDVLQVIRHEVSRNLAITDARIHYALSMTSGANAVIPNVVATAQDVFRLPPGLRLQSREAA